MFSFFKKKKSNVDFSVLGTDLHSHLIPGIDDGVLTVEESVTIIRQLGELGYKRLITTPHVISDYYPNSRQDILTGLKKVQQALVAENIDVELYAAAEYLMDEYFAELLAQENLLTLPGRYILVETGFYQEPPGMYSYLFTMQTKGYRPILAHPERYSFYEGDLDQYERLREYGCLFQVNLLSLTGHYGRPIREVAFKLYEADMVDFLGTDLHNESHLIELKELLKDSRVQEILKEGRFMNAELGMIAPSS